MRDWSWEDVSDSYETKVASALAEQGHFEREWWDNEEARRANSPEETDRVPVEGVFDLTADSSTDDEMPPLTRPKSAARQLDNLDYYSENDSGSDSESDNEDIQSRAATHAEIRTRAAELLRPGRDLAGERRQGASASTGTKVDTSAQGGTKTSTTADTTKDSVLGDGPKVSKLKKPRGVCRVRK